MSNLHNIQSSSSGEESSIITELQLNLQKHINICCYNFQLNIKQRKKLCCRKSLMNFDLFRPNNLGVSHGISV